MNKVILTGRLTRDPEYGVTTSGASVCKFTLAVQKLKDDVDFIDVIAWRKLADICKDYLHKGNKCGLIGRIEVENFESKDGSKKIRYHVVADEVEFLSEKNQDQTQTNHEQGDLKEIEDDDSLPF